jgi:Flp pilus assembly protein TadG
MKKLPSRQRAKRRGTILVLSAFLMIVMLAAVAFAVDLGYVFNCRNQMQRCADASAIAATWELIDEQGPEGFSSAEQLEAAARSTAGVYAALNEVSLAEPSLAVEDVEIGYLAEPSNPNCPLVPASGSTMPNAVRVRIQRTADQNGEIPLFFARTLGQESVPLVTEATAALLNSFGGFKMPADGSNLQMLPFALDVDTWNGLMNGAGSDQYCYDAESGACIPGSDGILEVNLYPQGTGSPGNRGTVDIGGSNNSTRDIARQIVEGVNSDDMQALENQGRTLELDDNGQLPLNGDTGISAGVKDELAAIIGEPRIIPIFQSVTGPGNNAEYSICMFAGVRIMHVKLTGSMSSKKVLIQPCNIVSKGGIPAPGATTSKFIYSPVWLVR